MSDFTLDKFIWYYNLMISRRSPKLQKDPRFANLAKYMNHIEPLMVKMFNQLNYTTYKQVHDFF